MCRDFCVIKGFSDIDFAPRLSHLILIGEVIGSPSSEYRFRNQRISVPAWARATYSASVEDKAVSVCLFDFHRIAPLAAMHTIPVVDFFSSALPYAASAYAIKQCAELYDLRYVIP